MENAQVENSIIMEGARIENPAWRIDSSIIGQNAVIKNEERRPSSVSLVIGDNSVVTV